MSSNAPEINRIGLTQVYGNDDADFDVVLVHGLNGHPKNTWTADDGTFWPTKLLANSLKDINPRILVYGYNADVYAFRKHVTTDMVHQHAQTLVQNLQADRSEAGTLKRPIIWIGHSLGGIVIKKTLNYAASLTNTKNDYLRDIYISTYGIIFLGTPHNGSDAAKWGAMLSSMCQAVFGKVKAMENSRNLIDTLSRDSETLQNIQLDFNNIMDRFSMTLFHEEEPTTGVGIVVDQNSAGTILPGCSYAGIAANHSEMCKFKTRYSSGYTVLTSAIKRYMTEAPEIIGDVRWPKEMEDRQRRKDAQVLEIGGNRGTSPYPQPAQQTPQPQQTAQNNVQGTSQQLAIEQRYPEIDQSTPSLSVATAQTVGDIEPYKPSPPKPLFVRPDGVRENTVFFGMEDTLKELDDRVFDSEARRRGTATVLLWCLNGGGKSHVARQYVFKNQHKFPGGVFWVQAKSKSEIWQGFWNIAEREIKTDLGKGPQELKKEAEKEKFVAAIKRWFETKQEWLLVFDGVTIDEDEDAEVGRLGKFMPDSTNSAIIITSIHRAVLEKRQALYSPKAVHVKNLEESAAIKLLLYEMDIAFTSATDKEKEKALKVVRHYNCLPLAIHAVGKRLKRTGQSLNSFQMRNDPSDDKIIDAFKDVLDDLQEFKHRPALNLMSILCYFDQTIPFEMVSMGLSILEEFNIAVKESGGKRAPNLNRTIEILLKYALLDRNEEKINSKAEDRTDTNFDVLNVYGVVQGVFIDKAQREQSTHVWLEHAIRLFCRSYETAHKNITEITKQGLVSDYRYYEVHGRRLSRHVTKYLREQSNRNLKNRRHDLKRTLDSITQEIQNRTPGSTQEYSVTHISIFDKQSSGSSNGPETPERKLTIDSTVSIINEDLPHHASPVTLHSATSQQSGSIMHERRNTEQAYRTDMQAGVPALLVRKDTTKSESHLEGMVSQSESHLQGMVSQPDGGHDLSDADLSDVPRDTNGDRHRTVKAQKAVRQKEKMVLRFIRQTPVTPLPATVNPVEVKADMTSRASSPSRMTARSGAEAALASVNRRASSTRSTRPTVQIQDSPGSDFAVSPTISDSPVEAFPSIHNHSSSSVHRSSPLSNILDNIGLTRRSRASSSTERPRPPPSPGVSAAQSNRKSSPNLPALNQNFTERSHEEMLRFGANTSLPTITHIAEPTRSSRRIAPPPSPLSSKKPSMNVEPQIYTSDYEVDMSRGPSTTSVWTTTGSEPCRAAPMSDSVFENPLTNLSSLFPSSAANDPLAFSNTGAWSGQQTPGSGALGGEGMSRSSSGPPGILSDNQIIPIPASPRTSPPLPSPNTGRASTVTAATGLSNILGTSLPPLASRGPSPLSQILSADPHEREKRFKQGFFRPPLPRPLQEYQATSGGNPSRHNGSTTSTVRDSGDVPRTMPTAGLAGPQASNRAVWQERFDSGAYRMPYPRVDSIPIGGIGFGDETFAAEDAYRGIRGLSRSMTAEDLDDVAMNRNENQRPNGS